MKSNRFLASVSLAVSLGITACNQADTPSLAGETGLEQGLESPSLNQEKRAAFEKEAIAIKARIPEGDALDRAMSDLLFHHGSPAPAAAIGGIAPFPVPEGGSVPAASGAAAKAAATDIYLRVKSLDITYPFALFHKADVPSGATLTAVTQHKSATVDPYMVAFYHTNGKDDYDKVTVVGLDDDGAGNLNSRIQWQNTTGAEQILSIIVFASNAATTGVARLMVTPYAGAPVDSRVGKIHATRVFRNRQVDADNCTGPIGTQIGLKRLTLAVYGTGILAVDKPNMRGGNIRDLQLTLDLGFPLKAAGGNFLLPYLQDNVGNVYEDNRYHAWQDDLYSCNIQP